MAHAELHRTEHIGWLRAAVLGANDGLISTSSLVIGVAAAQPGRDAVLLAAVAGRAAVARERRELAEQPRAELTELTNIYVARGLRPELAAQVAEQFTAHDALA